MIMGIEVLLTSSGILVIVGGRPLSSEGVATAFFEAHSRLFPSGLPIRLIPFVVTAPGEGAERVGRALAAGEGNQRGGRTLTNTEAREAPVDQPNGAQAPCTCVADDGDLTQSAICPEK